MGCEEEEEDEWVDGGMAARFVSRMAKRMDCTSSRWVRRASWSMGGKSFLRGAACKWFFEIDTVYLNGPLFANLSRSSVSVL